MKLALVVLAAALVFGGVTLFALEGREVVVLRTFGAGGAARDTRTWVADYDGVPHIEVANPEREFLHHILANPKVELLRRGEKWPLRATLLPQPTGHELIRRLLREKYGWADQWIGMLTDTSGSLAIRLDLR